MISSVSLWIDTFVPAFATLFVVIDPPGCAPIFASLTNDTSSMHQRAMARKAILVAAAILIVFAFLGRPLLKALGISLPAFQLAGGIMLFMIAIDMVFEKRTERREQRAEQVTEEARAHNMPLEAEDIAVFPMAMPMIAGPGSIASTMLLMANHASSMILQSAVLAALVANLLLTFIALRLTEPLLKLMGKTIAAVITRLLGVLLAALAAQFVFDGIRAAFEL